MFLRKTLKKTFYIYDHNYSLFKARTVIPIIDRKKIVVG